MLRAFCWVTVYGIETHSPSIHAPVMQLTDLDTDLLLSVCNLLDPCSLAGFGCVSRRLRSVVRAPELWEPCCRSRWRHLRAELYQQPANVNAIADSPNTPDGAALESSADDTNWKSLYDGGNGWRNPSFNLRQIPIDAECDFVSAIACAARGDHITVATSHSIEAWDPGDIPALELTLHMAFQSNHMHHAATVWLSRRRPCRQWYRASQAGRLRGA